MNLSEMDGAFTSGLIKKTIEWENEGEDFTAEVYVKPLSFSAAVSTMIGSDEDAERAIANRIALSICDKEGKAVFTSDHILGVSDSGRGALCEGLTYSLLGAIGEVKTKKKPKKKLTKKKSG